LASLAHDGSSDARKLFEIRLWRFTLDRFRELAPCLLTILAVNPLSRRPAATLSADTARQGLKLVWCSERAAARP
jgi:hypothetical protein